MTEDANRNEQAETNSQQPQAPGEQPAAQQVPQPPATPEAPQPPAQQPQAPAPPQTPAQPQQPPAPPEQPQAQQNQQNPQNQQQPTFRENGAFSFFATPSDPDDDPTPMSVGFKIGWFVLGLIGGMLGLVMAWLSTSTLSSKRRRQALIWTWAGFAVQAILFFIMVLTGGSLPFAPSTSTTAAQSAGSAGTGSTSAFG